MVETEIECKTYEVHAMCECGGEFKLASDVVYDTYPPLYCYQCDKCKALQYFSQNYPYIKYVKAENEALSPFEPEVKQEILDGDKDEQ